VTLSVQLGIPFSVLEAEDDATLATYLQVLDELAEQQKG
jgi:hypothetical protein